MKSLRSKSATMLRTILGMRPGMFFLILGIGMVPIIVSWISLTPSIYVHLRVVEQPKNDMAWGLLWYLILALLLVFLPFQVPSRLDITLLWLIHGFGAIFLVGILEMTTEVMDQYMYWATTADMSMMRSTGLVFGLGTEATDNTRWLIQLHRSFTPDSYQLTKISFAFIKFIGILATYRSTVILTGRENRLILWILGLLPSVIIWSGMIGKDAFNMLAFGLYLYAMANIIKGRVLPGWVAMLIATAVALLVRPWYFAIFVAGSVVYLLLKPVRPGFVSITKVCVIAVGTVGVFGLVSVLGLWGLVANPSALVAELHAMRESFATGGSATMWPPAAGTVGTVLYSPLILFTALYRPVPGEVMSVAGLLAGLESLIMLCFGLRAGYLALKDRKLLGRTEVWLLVLIVCWGTLFGLTVASNLGSIVRYRGPILPVMIMIWYFMESRRHYGSELVRPAFEESSSISATNDAGNYLRGQSQTSKSTEAVPG